MISQARRGHRKSLQIISLSLLSSPGIREREEVVGCTRCEGKRIETHICFEYDLYLIHIR